MFCIMGTSSRTIFIATGPTVTTKSDGRMQKKIGKISFTPNFAAFSSARGGVVIQSDYDPVALAHLRAPHFAPATAVELELTVEHRRLRAAALVTKLPFYDPARKRA